MRMRTKEVLRVTAAGVAGAVIGYFILHPYSAVFYSLYPLPHSRPAGTSLTFSEALGEFRLFLDTFNMWYVGIPYALIGALAGISVGIAAETSRRHAETRRREAARKAAHEALQELMVTLSHYLLNASTVIGGYSQLLLKKTKGTELEKPLEAIMEESAFVEAVVNSLKSLEAVKEEEYIPGGNSRMIDIKAELERRIAQSASRRDAAMEKEKNGEQAS
jgi:signal transduction histidine kinase